MTNRRIAVLEHQPTVRTAIRVLLRPADYDLLFFETADEFLDALDRQRPDFLILNPKVPDRFGLDLLFKLKANRIEIPVIILMGSYDEDLERRAVQLGVRKVMRAPFLEDLRLV